VAAFLRAQRIIAQPLALDLINTSWRADSRVRSRIRPPLRRVCRAFCQPLWPFATRGTPTEALPTLNAGASVPPMEVLDQSGRPQIIHFDTQTVVDTFTSTCPWCKRNAESVSALAAQLKDHRFIALCLDCVDGAGSVPLDKSVPY
jgi:hypothetical protein